MIANTAPLATRLAEIIAFQSSLNSEMENMIDLKVSNNLRSVNKTMADRLRALNDDYAS